VDDTVLIVSVVAIAVIVILFMFRERLKSFGFKASKDGLEANLDTERQGKAGTAAQADKARSINISGNRQIGEGNQIDVGRSSVNVEKNLQKGKNQKIVVRPQKSSGKKSTVKKKR
jgi:hypothetical protein